MNTEILKTFHARLEVKRMSIFSGLMKFRFNTMLFTLVDLPGN